MCDVTSSLWFSSPSLLFFLFLLHSFCYLLLFVNKDSNHQVITPSESMKYHLQLFQLSRIITFSSFFICSLFYFEYEFFLLLYTIVVQSQIFWTFSPYTLVAWKCRRIWNWTGCLLSLIFLTRSWNCFLLILLFYFDFENVLQIWWHMLQQWNHFLSHLIFEKATTILLFYL